MHFKWLFIKRGKKSFLLFTSLICLSLRISSTMSPVLGKIWGFGWGLLNSFICSRVNVTYCFGHPGKAGYNISNNVVVIVREVLYSNICATTWFIPSFSLVIMRKGRPMSKSYTSLRFRQGK